MLSVDSGLFERSPINHFFTSPGPVILDIDIRKRVDGAARKKFFDGLHVTEEILRGFSLRGMKLQKNIGGLFDS